MNALSIKRLAAFVLCAAVGASSVVLAAAPVSRKSTSGAPTVQVSGTVTDGSGHGWPLFARIEITSASTDPLVVFSDPVTGAYAADLPDATAYTFAVTAVFPGYTPGGGAVVTAGSPVDADWVLFASALCDAPGYGPGNYGPPVLSESFDAGVIPPGWTVQTVSGVSWEVLTGADPCGFFDGNRTGGSGPYAIVNSNCGFSFDDTYLVTPPIDLSSISNAAIRWANDFIDTGFGDIAEVDVSTDGGATWTNVWKAPGGVPGPGTITADMSFAAGHAAVQARFHYQMFFGFWWQVDDVTIGPFVCPILPGGLVVGNVTDANTGLGLNGATVTNLADDSSATTVAAPGQGDGFYSLFAAGSGSQAFEASADLHASVTANATVTLDAAVRLDFSLPAGLLDASPRPLSVRGEPRRHAEPDARREQHGDRRRKLRPSRGRRPSAERGGGLETRHRSQRRGSPGGAEALFVRPVQRPGLPRAAAKCAREGAARCGGGGQRGQLVPDRSSRRLWPGVRHRCRPDLGLQFRCASRLPLWRRSGLPVPARRHADRRDDRLLSGQWQGDGTYNARTGMIWQTDVAYLTGAPEQCLLEIDPVAKVVTGKTICGPWGNFPPLSGLAYDYATDTYYVGDSLGGITHVDNAGNLLDSGPRRTADLGARVQPDHAASLRPDLFEHPVRHLRRGPAQRLSPAERLFRDERRSSRAQRARRESRGRLQRPPLGLPRRRRRGLRVRVGRDGLVRHRHSLALGGPDVRHDPGLRRGFASGGRRQHAAGDGDVRLRGPPTGPSPAVARVHDGHAGPGRSRPGRLHGPLQRRAAGQLRVELHLRRGGSRRDAGVRTAGAPVRLLPERSRDAPEHGRLHRARGSWLADASAGLHRSSSTTCCLEASIPTTSRA